MAKYYAFYREVKHPILKLFVVIMVLLILIVLSPLLIPGHFLLRGIGRNGFYFDNRIVVEKESFQFRKSYHH